jgi:uncharacterized metal-binding protein YceD (DUF177 family)
MVARLASPASRPAVPWDPTIDEYENNDDPDVFFIARTESHIDVKQWLSEFVQLSMPTYPACSEEEIGGPKCNKEVLAMLEKLKENEEKKENPLWSGLDKFKDN